MTMRLSTPNTNKKKVDNTGVLPPLISLKCQLCEEYLKDPVTLPCLHSFCRLCLERYNAERLKKENNYPIKKNTFEDEFISAETKESDPVASNEEFINVQCPTCVGILKLPSSEEPQIPFENSRLARIVELVRESNVLCQNCKQSQSEVRCKVCNAWLCLECWEITHSALIFKTHEKEPLTHAEMFALPKCKIHPANDLEFFSTEEEVGVCQVCLLKGDFVGKPYCLVSDVRRARQHEIEKGVRAVIEQKERLLVGRQRMEQTMDLLNKKLNQQKEAVQKNFESIRIALQKREEKTLEALENLKKTKEDLLVQQIGQTDYILSVINDGVKNVKLILGHSNDLELVYLTIVLQEFVADLSNLKAKGDKRVDYFHSAAVDPQLPVLLSNKVADLVSAYAPVPTAVFDNKVNQDVEKVSKDTKGKLRLEQPKISKEHKEILKDVGAEQGDEYGCTMM